MSIESVLSRIVELSVPSPVFAPTVRTAPAAATNFGKVLAQTVSAQPTRATPYAAEIHAAATTYVVDPPLARAALQREPGFHPNATSPPRAHVLVLLVAAPA